MSCCAPGSEIALDLGPDRRDDEIRLASRLVGDGIRQTDLSVPGIHCGACIHRIETALQALPGVESARVNLSGKRASIRWTSETPPPFVATLRDIGYETERLMLDAEGLQSWKMRVPRHLGDAPAQISPAAKVL